MDKLLKHIMNAKNVSNKFLPHLTKAQFGKQAKSKPGQTVVVDGKKMNTYSDEYEQAYNKGIGQWRKYDSKTAQWNLLPNNLPSSAYDNAEFVSSERELPEVTVSAKMNPFVSAARKKAKEQAGALEAFKKREEASYPKWYKNTSLYNPEKDSQTQQDTYDSVVNRGTYQNLVDAIPQKQNESRVDYINRFNNLAGKNAVSLARQANVTEPFDPSNLYKLGQWGWKGLNHIAAVNQAFSPSNTRGIMPTIQEGINRGNMPISGMLPDEAKEVGITQPFDTVDNLAYQYGFRPALMAGDNLMDPAGKQARAFNSRYLGASDTDKVFTSLMNPLNYITGAEIFKGVKGIGDAIKTPLRTASVAQRNLKDLNYAKKVYGPLGYQMPENLERVAQSDLLTDRTIRGLVDRDNTFFRGVSTLEVLKAKLAARRQNLTSSALQGYDPMKVYDSLIDQLKKSGVDINNEEEVAKYMATHIPGETGGGRASLDENVFKKGLDGLYTSNSEGTAEGYTYGNGFIVKTKKPTDFSSSNRKSWIDYNNPDIQARDKYRLPFLSSKPITWKTEYQKLDQNTINNYRQKLGYERLTKEFPELLENVSDHTWKSSVPEMQQIIDRRNQLLSIADEQRDIASKPYRDKVIAARTRMDDFERKLEINDDPRYKRILKRFANPSFTRDIFMEAYYEKKLRDIDKTNSRAWVNASVTPWIERYPDLANAVPELNPYAHYIHIGKPGQKVLEPMSLRKISPDVWKRKSRGHQGQYFRQATRREFGGAYDNDEYNMGGQPCYECGGMYTQGGQPFYKYQGGGASVAERSLKDKDCGIQRGINKENARMNSEAARDAEVWARQSAKNDKIIAAQDAAKLAGQLNFDYDWSQSPVDKAEKKAAVAQYKQFFQQNPNVFIADDTSGYSPEQKYIIASKLKQRMSTPMFSKLAQQQFGIDPKAYDLQRIQSEMAPKMGGWNGMRNWLFNVFKEDGGEYDLPQAQWGQFVNPITISGAATLAAKAKEFFGFNEPKIVRTPASAPKRLSIRDPRKIMMTTGKPLRPNSDLVSGQYDSEQLGNLLTEAKRRNMSYNDMMNLAAMGFQETKWGRSDDNIGHTKGDFGDEPMQDSYSNFINAYNAKMKDADRLKIKDEATRLQVYNGLGKVFPSTEADYHGFKMKKIYGVEVPKGGIDLRKNPLYGKQVIDIRDNVLKRNPEFMRYMDSTYRAPMPKKQGGPILDARGQWAHPGKVTRIPGSDITMQGVPYPVYGVGSNGQEQMMYPDQEYDFGGASYVDEYPIMQGGGFKPPYGNLDLKKRWEDGYLPPLPTNEAAAERKFLTGWNNSPMGKQMLYNSVDKDDPSGINYLYADKIRSDRDALIKQANVNVYDHKTYNKVLSKNTSFKTSNDPDSGTAGYASRKNRLAGTNNIDNRYTLNAMFGSYGQPANKYLNFSKFIPKDNYEIHMHNESEGDASNQTLVHELGHASDASGYLMPAVDEQKIKNYSYGSDGKRKLTDFQKYVAEPTETRARLLNFRYNAKNQGLYDPFTQKATFDSLKKYEDRVGSGYDPLQQLRLVYNDKQIVDMLNTISEKKSNEVLPYAKNGGYTVTRSNDRKGKTHKVTGPGGVVKYFGDSKLGQHPKDPERKAAFYARHKKNLDGNPFFRAFARKTWQTGGPTPEVIMPRSLEELMAPSRRGVANFNVGYNNKSFSSNYGYSGPDNFKNGTHSLNFSIPSFMKTGNIDASAVYSPGRSYSANLTGMAPASFIKKGATMNFSGGYQKDINPMMKNTAAPSYNMSAGFRIPTKAGNFTVNASYRK
jgi:hypothetical protein